MTEQEKDYNALEREYIALNIRCAAQERALTVLRAALQSNADTMLLTAKQLWKQGADADIVARLRNESDQSKRVIGGT